MLILIIIAYVSYYYENRILSSKCVYTTQDYAIFLKGSEQAKKIEKGKYKLKCGKVVHKKVKNKLIQQKKNVSKFLVLMTAVAELKVLDIKKSKKMSASQVVDGNYADENQHYPSVTSSSKKRSSFIERNFPLNQMNRLSSFLTSSIPNLNLLHHTRSSTTTPTPTHEQSGRTMSSKYEHGILRQVIETEEDKENSLSIHVHESDSQVALIDSNQHKQIIHDHEQTSTSDDHVYSFYSRQNSRMNRKENNNIDSSKQDTKQYMDTALINSTSHEQHEVIKPLLVHPKVARLESFDSESYCYDGNDQQTGASASSTTNSTNDNRSIHETVVSNNNNNNNNNTGMSHSQIARIVSRRRSSRMSRTSQDSSHDLIETATAATVPSLTSMTPPLKGSGIQNTELLMQPTKRRNSMRSSWNNNNNGNGGSKETSPRFTSSIMQLFTPRAIFGNSTILTARGRGVVNKPNNYIPSDTTASASSSSSSTAIADTGINRLRRISLQVMLSRQGTDHQERDGLLHVHDTSSTKLSDNNDVDSTSDDDDDDDGSVAKTKQQLNNNNIDDDDVYISPYAKPHTTGKFERDAINPLGITSSDKRKMTVFDDKVSIILYI